MLGAGGAEASGRAGLLEQNSRNGDSFPPSLNHSSKTTDRHHRKGEGQAGSGSTVGKAEWVGRARRRGWNRIDWKYLSLGFDAACSRFTLGVLFHVSSSGGTVEFVTFRKPRDPNHVHQVQRGQGRAVAGRVRCEPDAKRTGPCSCGEAHVARGSSHPAPLVMHFGQIIRGPSSQWIFNRFRIWSK